MTVTVIILSVAIFAFLIGVSAGIAIALGRGKTKEEQDREDKAQVSFCSTYSQKKKSAHLVNSSEAAPRFCLGAFLFRKKTGILNL